MKKPLLLFILLSLGVLTQRAVAQPGGGGPIPGGPTPVPIDGGVSLLLAGGVAYGLKRIRQRQLH